jgi:hypothetical protein
MTPYAQAAQAYRVAGMHPLLLHGRRADGSCTCHNPECRTPGKHPQGNRWWERARDGQQPITGQGNIGLATGIGFWVLDIDPRNGGLATWSQLQLANDPLPLTPMAHTGGGGTHVLLQLPEGATVDTYSLGEGIECLAHGRQIVVAPSVHPSGRTYRWSQAHIWNTEIAPTPSWLARLVFKEHRTKTYAPPTGPAAESLLGRAFASMGWVVEDLPGSKISVLCPWGKSTSGSSTAILPPTREHGIGAFSCMHENCKKRVSAEHGCGTIDVVRLLPDDVLRPLLKSDPRAFGEAMRLRARARKAAANG